MSRLKLEGYNSIQEMLAASMNMSVEEYNIYLEELHEKNNRSFLDSQKENEHKRPNKTTKEHVNELHKILVQTCINYINENNLHDIEEIVFSADSLQTSADYNEWTPATDSSITAYGLNLNDLKNGLVEKYEICSSY